MRMPKKSGSDPAGQGCRQQERRRAGPRGGARAGTAGAVAGVGAGGGGSGQRAAAAFGSARPRRRPPRSAEADAAAYERCMKLARDEPEAGRKQAQEWQEQRRRPSGGPLLRRRADRAAAIQGGRRAASKPWARRWCAPRRACAPRFSTRPGRPGCWRAIRRAPTKPPVWRCELRPDDPELLLDRAEAAGAAGWYDKAAPDLDRVLKADPSRVEALIYRAAANRALDRLDPALDDITEALKLAPDSVPALLERGNIRALRGDAEGARLDWERVAAASPGSLRDRAVAAQKEPRKGRLTVAGGRGPTRAQTRRNLDCCRLSHRSKVCRGRSGPTASRGDDAFDEHRRDPPAGGPEPRRTDRAGARDGARDPGARRGDRAQPQPVPAHRREDPRGRIAAHLPAGDVRRVRI